MSSRCDYCPALLPDDCRCFANPILTLCLRQHTKPDRCRVKTLFVSWYLINSHLLCLDGNIMVRSLECICLWSKDVGHVFSSVGPADHSLFPLRPWCILNSTWTSKCCVFNQKDISFIGNLLFIPGLPPVEQAERPFSFCFSWGL